MKEEKKPPFTIKEESIVYKNNMVTISSDKVVFEDGLEKDFTKVKMLPGSSVIAINDNQEIYLIEEFKHGITAFSMEAVSGAIDGKETPLEAGKRELKEEIGLEAKEWTNLGLVNPLTSGLSCPNYIFLAQDIVETESNPEPGEIIRVIKMPFQEAVDMVISSKITHAGSCVAILKAEKYLSSKK